MKIKLARNNIIFLGRLGRCGALPSQLTLLRTAAALALLRGEKLPSGEATEEFMSYLEVDDRTVFFLVLNHRGEAANMEEAVHCFGRYCGRGLDIIEGLLDEKDMDGCTLDDIIVKVGESVSLDGRGRE